MLIPVSVAVASQERCIILMTSNAAVDIFSAVQTGLQEPQRSKLEGHFCVKGQLVQEEFF